jgi:hypothetical protein
LLSLTSRALAAACSALVRFLGRRAPFDRPFPFRSSLDIVPMTPSARQLLKRVGLRVATLFLGDDAGRFN